ncbi:MAG TPA: transglutaminase-like domain-containing protein [Terriglobales bacterium]|nr:transglutaminase-like domain-containing protein [Terriglobales bacterium]
MTSPKACFALLALLSLSVVAPASHRFWQTRLEVARSSQTANGETAETSRHFSFHYEFAIKSVDPGQTLRVWIPLAHSDKWQTVRVTHLQGDLPLKKTQEKRYGNWMLYASTVRATKSDYHFAVDYDVLRYERSDLTEAQRKASETPSASPATVKPAGFDLSVRRYLAPDKLVPVTGLPAQIASKTVEGKNGELQQARAIYDYVLANMRYDKSGTGWGHGDALWACNAKHGNCTDFHSLFMSMARSQGIPARFEIGFPIPSNEIRGEIPGYHCWSEFYLSGGGWIPVDISEAWKNQSKKDYYFGSYDANRVQFTLGRDIVLSPAQAGEPLNYFVYPYVEVGGKTYDNVLNSFSFADVGTHNQSVPAAKASGR